MIRQISDNGKRSSKNDLILLGILLFLVFFAGAISRFIKAIPAPFNAPAMLVLFAGVAGLCLWIYRKILCSFCYTLVYAPSDPEDLDAFGNPVPRPFPVGTLNIERMLGDKGRLLAQIPLDSIRSFEFPGEASSAEGKKQIFTLRPRSGAHRLAYTLSGRDFVAFFSPSPELAQKLKSLLENKAQ